MDVSQWGYPKKRKIPEHCLRMSSGGSSGMIELGCLSYHSRGRGI